MTEPTTQDGFLGGKLRISQPKDGFRSGHDAVLLAACIDPTMPVEKLCELGSGVGVVSLCAAARLPQLDVTGIEIDPVQVALARDNAAQNGLAERVRFVAGDLTAPFDTLGLTANGFDMVLANPPYYRAGTVPEPDNRQRRGRIWRQRNRLIFGSAAPARWRRRALISLSFNAPMPCRNCWPLSRQGSAIL